MTIMKGSRKCILDLVSSANFLSDINTLIKGTNAIVQSSDIWIPKGHNNMEEAELKDFLKQEFSSTLGEEIRKWWLAVSTPNTRTPNWDLVSTCRINNSKGILLVEAKAHFSELNEASQGKPMIYDTSENSNKNHVQIASAIAEANNAISIVYPGVSISRDKCYQLSNRISHAWWLANKGIPVVLMYLGFLNSEDMNDGKRTLFKTDTDWHNCFDNHAKQVGVNLIKDKWVECGKSRFLTICRSY